MSVLFQARTDWAGRPCGGSEYGIENGMLMEYEICRGVTADSPSKESLFGVKPRYHHRSGWRMSGGQVRGGS
jgi:hypothetical protein